MKKAKGFIIAGSILLGVGLLVFVIFMSTLGWDFMRLDTETFTPAAYAATAEETAAVTDVWVKVETGKVIVQKGDTLRVDYEENKKVKTTVSVADGRLSVSQTTEKISFTFFNFKRSQIKTVITLPDGVFDIFLDASNGEVKVGEGTYGDAVIESSNGRIDINDITAQSLSAENNNGQIEVKDIVIADKLSLESNNGRIKVTDSSASDMNIKSASGRAEFENVTTDTLFASSHNGRVILTNVTATIKVEVESNNGQIELSSLDCGDIKLISDNGRIEGTIKGVSAEYRITAASNNGTVNVPGGSEVGQYVLYARSNNGRIHISFIG